jgi:hypothetical protein
LYLLSTQKSLKNKLFLGIYKMSRYSGGMAKTAGRGKGRPKADVPLDERILVRFDKTTRQALEEYSKRTGAGAAATAVRMVVIEKLRADGFLTK